MAVFSNQATLTYTGGTALSNVVTGEVLDRITVTKTAVGNTYEAGGTVTYVISLSSCGCCSSPVEISDDLGAYPFGEEGTLVPLSYVEGSLLYYANGVLQETPDLTAGPPLTVNGIVVPAGGNVLLVYKATFNEYAPIAAGSCVTNTVTVSEGCLPEPIDASETVCIESRTALSIEKSLCPTTVCDDGKITYTFVISNAGNIPAVATDNLTVSDTFLPILTDITVTLNGDTLVAGTDYTYDEATGVFSTTPGRITVPAATVTQDPETGAYSSLPGTATLIVTGKV